MVNRVVSETERIKIQGYLARKWGLMSTMFSGSHPYYSTDPYQPTVTQGGEDATVTFYWGDNNASTNAGSWDNNAQIAGTHGVGVVSKALTGLTKGTTYYYTTKVNNSGGNVWGTVKSFVPANTALGKNTVPDLALWLDATDVDGDGASDSSPTDHRFPHGPTSPTPAKPLTKVPQGSAPFTKPRSSEPSQVSVRRIG